MWITKLLYFFLLGIIFLFSLLYLPEFSVYLWICLLLLPILLFATAHWSGSRLYLRLQLPSQSVVSGTPVSGTILITNRTPLPIGTAELQIRVQHLTLEETLETRFRLSVPPNQTIRFVIPVTPVHCGCIRLEVQQIRVFDWLHLFSHRKSFCRSGTFTVFPAIAAPPESKQIHLSHAPEQMRTSNAPMERIGVRTYQQGDRLRAIHWKLSSRFEDPVVLEYGEPIQTTITIGFLYALHSDAQNRGERLDAMLEALTACAVAAQQADTVLTIFCYTKNGYQQRSVSSQEAFYQFLTLLLEQPPCEATDSIWQQTAEYNGVSPALWIADVPPSSGLPQGQCCLTAGITTDTSIPIAPKTAANTVYAHLHFSR